MKKRFQTLCVALLALVLCNTPLFAYDFEVDGIAYNVVTSSTDSTDNTVEVTFLGDSYWGNRYSGSITITIPESVTYNGNTYSVTAIGHHAFSYCYGVTKVTIPNSVTSIEYDAFNSCESLKEVVIPNSVTTIGYSAFEYCYSLTDITIPNSVTTIEHRTFENCYSLTDITIPNSVTTIGEMAFSDCRSLTDITIPNSVTTIGEAAFEYCSSLTDITIPNSVTTIGFEAFAYCGLTGITIPSSVTTIVGGSFSGCNNLTSLTIAAGNPKYDSRDNCNAIIETQTNTLILGCNSTVIPNSVTTIGNQAFCECTGLTNITIPNSVTTIGEMAFSGCYGLTEVIISNSVKTIKESAFSSCSNLTKITIPNSVTTIGGYAFANCGLTEINIPNSITTIESGTFNDCDSLTTITIPSSVTTIGSHAFGGIRLLKNITIPNSVTSIGYSAFSDCENLTEITIPNRVTTIEGYTFSGCSRLENVTIPSSVTTIGYSAFEYCENLTEINIPNSVTTIENGVFYNCTGLTKITIPNRVTTIGGRAFNGCTGLKNITIPNSVTTIGGDAFAYCTGLTKITIPNSVSTIGYEAFYYCTGLTDIVCTAAVPPTCDWGAFYRVNTSTCTLHIYEPYAQAYAEAPQWQDFLIVDKVVPLPIEDGKLEITDGELEKFDLMEDMQIDLLTYNRILPNAQWNALYLPVEIPVEALSDNYDVAYFNNMHAYDRNDDGTIDEMDMEIFLIKEGTLHANYPYFIRAKSEAAQQMVLELSDVTLYDPDGANNSSITTSSAFMNFELTGVYTRHGAEELPDCYAINTSGAWSPIAAGSYLNPFRCYLKMTARDGSPVKVDEALKSIRIRVHGEDGTTDIDNMTINGQQPAVIYDLQGRRVSNPGKGMYIVNGKKVMLQ